MMSSHVLAISTIADETQMLGTAIRYICKFLSTTLGKIFTDAVVLRKNNVVSTVAITLMVGDRAFGVLSVHDVQRRKFSTAELQFIGAAANAIGARLLALSKIAATKT